MAVDMPTQKRLPPVPDDGRRSDTEEGNGHSSGDADAGGGGGCPTRTHPPMPKQREGWRKEDDGEKEWKHEVEVGREDNENAVPLQEDLKEDSEENVDHDGVPPPSGKAEYNKREYILIKLSDIRKEVQCPICLGIIRKTRTVMECLHRFCRECIDKSMRLGNNECPACRTHCASRRSLRDDPNYDALIALLYPDVERYEEEELTFHEEDVLRNKQIQASIAETYQRQTEALAKKRTPVRAAAASAAFFRGQSSLPTRTRSRTTTAPDQDDHHHAGSGNGTSSADDSSPDLRQKRRRKSSDELPSDQGDSSAGSRDALVWGKNGARSQIRHGGSGVSSGKNSKPARITRIVDFLNHSPDEDDELDVHLTLVPEEGEDLPLLPRPHLRCRPTVSVRHLRQFVALHAPVKAGDLQILFTSQEEELAGDRRELRVAEAEETLAGILGRTGGGGDLVLVYRLKSS